MNYPQTLEGTLLHIGDLVRVVEHVVLFGRTGKIVRIRKNNDYVVVEIDGREHYLDPAALATPSDLKTVLR